MTFDCLSSSCLFPPPSHPVMRAFCTLHYCFRSWHSGHSTLTTDTSLDLDYTVLRLHLGHYLSPSSLTFKYLNHFYNLIGFLWEKVGEDEARNPYIYFLGFFSKLTTISYQSRERSLFCLALEMDCENQQERHWTAHGRLRVYVVCVCARIEGRLRALSLRG